MARALTGPELAHLRSNGQRCRLFLAVHTPATVFTARLNGAPSSTDRVAEITFDGGSADFADCLAGQTVYVGSEAGAHDVGIVRLRGTIAGVAGTMEIGETSEIDWTDNDYLTVVDEFALWPRHLRITGAGVVYVDYDVAYSDQHANCDPVPVLGPPAVKWLTGATVDVEFDAGDSWVVGSTISAYSWAAPGASGTADMATATPTITYDAAGTYRVACTVTATNGASFTGYRYVFVYDTNNQPATVFRIDDCAGDWQGGGWRFRVTMSDEARRSEIRDRAQIILFARDWYGDTEISIGPVADRENVVAVGWIDGESIEWFPEQGTVSFDVQGPQFWMDKMTSFPSGVEDYDGTPTDWVEFEDLTVDKGLWHFLHWRTTATLCTDVALTGDDRQIKVFDAPAGNLWQQITQESERTILAHPACDRYGRLFVEIDSNLTPEADRASIPVVQTLLAGDWHSQINLERRTSGEAALVDLSGVAYAGGGATAYFALSPGHVFKRYGSSIERRERLALDTQSTTNVLAGLVAGKANNEYPALDLSLAGNHRAVDICPLQYLQLSVAGTDTERGIVLTDFYVIPRRVSFRHDAETGMLLTDMTVEGYTTPELAVTGDPPLSPPDAPAPELPPGPIPPPTPEPWEGDVKACLAFTGQQIAVTDDLLRHHVESTCTAGTSGTTLYDTAVDFEALEVEAGDIVENLDDHSWTTVVTVVSATQLTLAGDVGLSSGDAYHIGMPQWTDRTPSLGETEYIIDVVYVQTVAATVGAWLLTNQAVYFASNAFSPSWSERLSLDDMRDLLGSGDDFAGTFQAIAVNPMAGYCIVHCDIPWNYQDYSHTSYWVHAACATADLGATWEAVLFEPSAQWAPVTQVNELAMHAEYNSVAVAAGVIYAVRRVPGYGPTNKGYTDVWVDGEITGGTRADGITGEANDFHGMRVLGTTVYIHVAISPSDPEITHNFAVSTNGGVDFSSIDPSGYSSLGSDIKPTGHFEDTSDVIVVAERDSDGDEVLLRSATGGSSWSEIGNAYDLFDYRGGVIPGPSSFSCYVWEPDADVLLWAGRLVSHDTVDSRRLFWSDNGGTTWFLVNGDWYDTFPTLRYNGNLDPSGTSNGMTGLIPLPRVGVNE